MRWRSGSAALATYLWLRRAGCFERFAATIRPVARASKLFGRAGFAGTWDASMVLGLKAAGIMGGAASGILILSRFMYFVPATLVGLAAVVGRYGGFKLARRQLASESGGLNLA